MNVFFQIVLATLSVYALTHLLTETYAFKAVRQWFREFAWEVFPRRLRKHFVQWYADDIGNEWPILEDEEDIDRTLEREIKGFDPIACSSCSGLWITVVVCACSLLPVAWWFAVYGAMVFMNKQER